MRYFIADIHNKDENILTYEHRPFKDVEDMRSVIINNWNSTINDDDEVYLCGDIGDIEILEHLRGNLNIHGHLHRFNYGLLNRKWKDGNRYFCVSVEQINYTPISEIQIKELLGV